MRYTWLDEYLLQKRGVTKDLQPVWNWVRYMIGGRMFAALCLDKTNKPYYINLKLEPMEGEFYRAQYPDVIPGYYSDKLHWNSIRPDGAVPDELLRQMLDKSYALVLAGLPKKQQRAALGLTVCGSECISCALYGKGCAGCNEAGGRVFHAPAGKPCPIYGCCVNKKHLATCKGCPQLSCGIWQAVRDPSLTEEEFQQDTARRVERLKGV